MTCNPPALNKCGDTTSPNTPGRTGYVSIPKFGPFVGGRANKRFGQSVKRPPLTDNYKDDKLEAHGNSLAWWSPKWMILELCPPKWCYNGLHMTLECRNTELWPVILAHFWASQMSEGRASRICFWADHWAPTCPTPLFCLAFLFFCFLPVFVFCFGSLVPFRRCHSSSSSASQRRPAF